MDAFFSHENKGYPPSLSQFGGLRSGTKSDLAHCLEKIIPIQENTPDVSAVLRDSAVIVNMLKPGSSKTFLACGQDIFLKYIKSQLHPVSRPDIVRDEYIPDSLKETARSKRRKGVRRRVDPSSRIPGNCEMFLKVDENKAELFKYLAGISIILECGDKEVISTHGKNVLCNHDKSYDTSNIISLYT